MAVDTLMSGHRQGQVGGSVFLLCDLTYFVGELCVGVALSPDSTFPFTADWLVTMCLCVRACECVHRCVYVCMWVHMHL